jgi:hypothetical protein
VKAIRAEFRPVHPFHDVARDVQRQAVEIAATIQRVADEDMQNAGQNARAPQVCD